MVIDPALFKYPVTIAEWAKAMMGDSKVPHVTKTKLGEPPTLPDGKKAPGTGYSSGADPRDIDAAAKKILDEFRAKEAARRRK